MSGKIVEEANLVTIDIGWLGTPHEGPKGSSRDMGVDTGIWDKMGGERTGIPQPGLCNCWLALEAKPKI